VIRRLLFRGPAPAADREATRTEAQLDLRDARIEALLTENAELRRQLLFAGVFVWYYRGARKSADERTVVLPLLRRWRHRADRTEVFRR
jgi:hypothetical protein